MTDTHVAPVPPSVGTPIARREARATRWAIIVFALTALAVALISLEERAPLAGARSVGGRAAWFAAGFAGLTFAAVFVIERSRGRGAWRARLPVVKEIVDIAAMSLGMGFAAYLITTSVFQLFQLGFKGLTVDPIAGGVLAGAAAAGLTYVSAIAGSHVTSAGLALLAIGILFLGTMAAMVSSPDETWWQLHFSQLGNTEGVTSSRFNFTLLATGLLLTVLANYVGRDFERGLAARGSAQPRLVAQLSWLFAGIGVLLAIVGLVPDAMNVRVHVGAATGMVIVFGVFALLALRRLPGVPHDFTVLTVIVVIGIVAAVLLWVPVGYFNLTGLEFVAAGLLFAWLTVFVRMASAYAAPSAAEGETTVAEADAA